VFGSLRIKLMNMKSECARDPTDREIQIARSTRQIKIDPRPQPDSYSSTSVDLTLDVT
jgi:hypothetical protein